ncbi:MAG: phospholipase [Flavobacteriaceae bacterium]|nr:phospholipase [Flavobacteriaceae bacterium]
MKKLLFSLLFVSQTIVLSQEFSKELFVSDKDSLPYRLLLPKNFDKAKKYPLIVFLHGAGERGNDNELQLVHGKDLFINMNKNNTFPSIVVFPQCSKNSYWANVSRINNSFSFLGDPTENKSLKLVEGMINELQSNFKINSNQIYVGGLSMGGMGTFELVYRNPDMFAAAFAICGGANPKIGEKISKTNWRIYHGDKDFVVPVKLSIDMYNSIKSFNKNVYLKIYPNVNHNSWDNVFREPDLFKWLFSNSKAN